MSEMEIASASSRNDRSEGARNDRQSNSVIARALARSNLCSWLS